MPKIKKGTKISDLAGSWNMTDEEAEEIVASIRKMGRSSEEASCSKQTVDSK
jgi:hypothetical protein